VCKGLGRSRGLGRNEEPLQRAVKPRLQKINRKFVPVTEGRQSQERMRECGHILRFVNLK